MSRRSRATFGLIAACVMVALHSSGCSSRRPVWVPEGPPRTLPEVEQWAREADLSNASGIEREDAPEARTEVLVWLRKQGPEGDRAAELLTEGFPRDVEAVPTHVEIASVDGTPSLVVLEAVPGPSGALDARRLWVFEMSSGRLVTSSSYR